jgi:hypothetical protein
MVKLMAVYPVLERRFYTIGRDFRNVTKDVSYIHHLHSFENFLASVIFLVFDVIFLLVLWHNYISFHLI